MNRRRAKELAKTVRARRTAELAAEQQRALAAQALKDAKSLDLKADELDASLPRAFTVPFAELGDNWTAEHHRRRLQNLIADGEGNVALAAAARFID